MLPPGHLAVGYVLYSIFSRGAYRAAPTGAAVLTLAVGTQFPDLVDKTLYYWFELLPSGRSLSHSLVVAAPVSLAIVLLASRYERGREGVAFAIGWISHIPGDAYGAVLSGDYADASYLLWPVYPGYDGTAESFGFHLVHHVPDIDAMVREPIGVLLLTSFGNEVLVGLLVTVVWAFDGFPGAGVAWHATLGRVTGSRTVGRGEVR